MNTKGKIVDLYQKSNEYSVNDIHEEIGVSKQMIHRVLKQLVEESIVRKVGKPPKTVYQKIEQPTRALDQAVFSFLTNEDKEFLHENFIVITELGQLYSGQEAFLYWCDKRDLPFKKTFLNYRKTLKKYDQYFESNRLINGISKMKNTKGIESVWLDDLFYHDFYAIERYGKTKLGTLLHFAKQTQSEYLMDLLLDEIKVKLNHLVNNNSYDAIGIVPPTVGRKRQLMNYLEKKLNFRLPLIQIEKLGNLIPVPQKSLSKLNERISNARNSFKVDSDRAFDHILLIDDAVGSGTTLNELARKIKFQKIARKVSGLAIVGSFKGFDVITDV